jgi:hypothetical protein
MELSVRPMALCRIIILAGGSYVVRRRKTNSYAISLGALLV